MMAAAGNTATHPMHSEADNRFMGMALSLAQRSLGICAPNPAVGCVLVKPDDGAAGRVVGRGWTEAGGRPHAEAVALARAGEAARGATAYISLEPCCHFGVTPPCTDALIAAGVTRAVIAVRDPDPRVNGQGIATLRAAGLTVDEGLRRAEAEATNAGFFLTVRAGRPMVTLKLATTMDGRIATHTGDSRWITCETARHWAHGLRARHDAVMVGSGTVLADDPLLDCRLPGLEGRSPVRIVVDRRLRMPLTAKLVATAQRTPTWLVTRADADRSRLQALRDCGVQVLAVGWEAGSGMPDLRAALVALAKEGITRVLVEGGAVLAAAMIEADLVDRIHWVRAASLVGGDGVSAVAPLGVDRIDQSRRFLALDARRLGQDMLETYARVP